MKKNNILNISSNNLIYVILFLAIIIRLIFFLSLQPWRENVVKNEVLVSDASGYQRLALSILENKDYSGFGAFRTPGYPTFAAIIYSIFSQKVWIVLLFQILLNISSIFLLYKIAFMVFNHKIALLSSFLFAIDVHQSLYSNTLLSDILFVFLFLLSVYFLIKNYIKQKYITIILSGFLLGGATLVRPVAYFFPIVVILFILIFYNTELKNRIIYLVVYGLIFFITISPWLLRNHKKYGHAKLSSVSGYNLLYYNVAYTEVYSSGKNIEEVRKSLTRQAINSGIDTTKGLSLKNSEIFTNIAKEYIKNNPIKYTKRHTMGIINMYAGLSTKKIASIFNLKSKNLELSQFGGPNIFRRIIDFFRSKSTGEIIIAIGIGIYLLINYLFFIYSIFWIFQNKTGYLILFLLIISYFSAVTGVVGLTRLRLPFMPYINLLSACGIVTFYNKYKNVLN